MTCEEFGIHKQEPDMPTHLTLGTLSCQPQSPDPFRLRFEQRALRPLEDVPAKPSSPR